jgi:DNA-binding IclR family transcriptional regulator
VVAVAAALANFIVSLMLRDLALAAQMLTGQAHTYPISFRKLRLVERDASGRYELGPFSRDLGLTRLRGAEPYQVASEAVVSLARDLALPVLRYGHQRAQPPCACKKRHTSFRSM